MKNFLEVQQEGIELPKFSYVVGCEDLTLTERFREWGKAIFLSIQKIYAKFTFNIHRVEMSKELTQFQKNPDLFYQHQHVAFPVPEYFTKHPGWMVEYVNGLRDTVILLNALSTESEVMYSRMKKFASTGKMPPQFRWVVTDTVRLMERAETFMGSLNQNRGDFQLKEVYRNVNEMTQVVDSFNVTVKNFKSRDAEILTRDLNRVYDITSLVTEKMKVNDIVVTRDDIMALQTMMEDFSRLANTTGAMLVLLNEFSAVMVDTRDTLKTILIKN